MAVYTILTLVARQVGRDWLTTVWTDAREIARSAPATGAVRMLDEIQKVPGWSDTVKGLWDTDTASGL